MDLGIGRIPISEYSFSPDTSQLLMLWDEANEEIQRDLAAGLPENPDTSNPLMAKVLEVADSGDPGVVIIDLLALVDALKQTVINMNLERMIEREE